jgi:hypothetical protein
LKGEAELHYRLVGAKTDKLKKVFANQPSCGQLEKTQEDLAVA